MSTSAADDGAAAEPVPSDEQVELATVVFGLLADQTRLRIVHQLSAGECDVTGLAEVAGCSATAASQHLARLRLAGLAAGSRDGRRVVYRLRDARLRGVLAAIFSVAQPEPVAADGSSRPF